MDANGHIYATREPVPEEDRKRFEEYTAEHAEEARKAMEEAQARLVRAEAKGLVL